MRQRPIERGKHIGRWRWQILPALLSQFFLVAMPLFGHTGLPSLGPAGAPMSAVHMVAPLPGAHPTDGGRVGQAIGLGHAHDHTAQHATHGAPDGQPSSGHQPNHDPPTRCPICAAVPSPALLEPGWVVPSRAEVETAPRPPIHRAWSGARPPVWLRPQSRAPPHLDRQA